MEPEDLQRCLQFVGDSMSIWRRKRNLSQFELAAKLGVSRASIANREAGKGITLECLIKTAAILDCPVTEFFYE